MISLRTETQALTDTGKVREINEDRYLAAEDDGVWVVADGMGGMARGDWAAGAITDAVSAGFADAGAAEADFDARVLIAAEAIRAANAAVVRESAARGAQMGSTVVALVLRERRFAALWTGDSRIYLLRGPHLHRLTRDHSQVQELIDAGLLTEEAAAVHPARNVLTRAIGITEPVEIDMISDVVEPGDTFLLCSDGLYNVITDAEIADFLRRFGQGNVVAAMVKCCLERGAPDNVTVVAVMASEPTLLRLDRPIALDAR